MISERNLRVLEFGRIREMLAEGALTEIGAVKLVEDLASCRVPYVCPRGKPTMIFTSNRELDRKFSIG